MDMKTGGGLGPPRRESAQDSAEPSAPAAAGADQNRDGDLDPGLPADTLELERSARRHDQEARVYDQWAAETRGPLHLGFLHAAEAHRAAARQDRAMGAAQMQCSLTSSSRDSAGLA